MCSHNSDRSNPAQTFQIQRDSHFDTNWISLPTKNPERKFEYIKNRVSSDARTGNYWNPSRDRGDGSPWHHKARIPAVSNNYVMVAKSRRTTKKKHSHSFDFKATFKKTVSWTKGVFSSVNASRNAKKLVAWAERKHDNPRCGWKRKLIKSR